MAVLASLGRRFAVVVAPPRCAACANSCAPAQGLCERCARDLAGSRHLVEPGPPGVDLAVTASPFEGAARAIVHGLKYGRRLALAAPAAEAIARACPVQELAGTVVPVPAAPWRWRWRGFDPAEELAIALARSRALRFSSCLRRGQGPRQVGRPRSERLADPPAVRLRRPAPATALLVDDVHTTGATLAACAAALRAGGCDRVIALTLARAGRSIHLPITRRKEDDRED